MLEKAVAMANDVVNNVRGVLNNLISSWDISQADKDEELKETKVLFAGWSWKFRRFDIGVFVHEHGAFEFHHRRVRLPFPWKEINRSLLFIGDYEAEYKASLLSVLERRHGKHLERSPKLINFEYDQ